MPDREKVINGLMLCSDIEHYAQNCGKCPYGFMCFQLLRDALALLKEQEAVVPRVSTAEQMCGNCNKVIEMDGWKVCPWCGKRIDWKGWWKKNGTRNQDS